MKKALIDPLAPVLTGYRVAQVEPTDQIFPVGDPYFWFDCADDVVQDEFWYDPKDQSIKIKPEIILSLEVFEPDMITAHMQTERPHHLKTGDVITLSGQSQIEYSGTFEVTVVDETRLEYTMLTDAPGDCVLPGSYIINY